VVYTYLISYSVNGGEQQQETISAGVMAEAVQMFKSNMRMAYQPNYRIHAVWVLLKEFKQGASYE